MIVENPALLSVDLGRIRIRREGHPDAFVLPRDIAVLCLHHHTIQLSVHVLRALAEGGAGVVVTDMTHHPCAWLLPGQGNGELVRRLRQQIALDTLPLKAELWRQLVHAKLLTQAVNLRTMQRKGALRIERLAAKIKPGDAGKIEGQAAKHYWAHLLEDKFRRTKQGATDPINIRLNFGYAVLRSMIARALVMAGLNPALGLGHHSTENPFNLADDFIEPYRFLVERYVVQGNLGEFNAEARKRLLGFVGTAVRIDETDYRMPAAVAETVNSYLRVLDGREETLSLPCDTGSRAMVGED